MSSKKLVLFDVDHTLMDVGDCHKKAFAVAFKEILGIDFDIKGFKYHGYTDLQIIHTIMDENKIEKNPEKIKKIIKIMIDEFKKQNLRSAVLMPGVPKILQKLKDYNDIVIGLVTGNLEEIAYTKLKHFKIEEYFILGGFGDISIIRADLIDYAIKKAEEIHGKIKKSDVFIIGDTIHDIAAAKAAGTKVLAVSTGTTSTEILREKHPDYLFKNLKYANKIVDVIING